jgi:hypothetical protein
MYNYFDEYDIFGNKKEKTPKLPSYDYYTKPVNIEKPIIPDLKIDIYKIKPIVNEPYMFSTQSYMDDWKRKDDWFRYCGGHQIIMEQQRMMEYNPFGPIDRPILDMPLSPLNCFSPNVGMPPCGF